MTDAQIVSLTLWGEARGEAVEGRIAVACVLKNRLRTGRWGASYASVCQAPMQFSCWQSKEGQANFLALMALSTTLEAGGSIDDALYRECAWIAEGLLDGRLRDRVRSATHYYVTTTTRPAWAVGLIPVCVVGAHSFFAGVK